MKVCSGLVEVDVRYLPNRDVYRGEVSWPEMSNEAWERARRGEIVAVGALRHGKIAVVRAANVLVRFMDVTRPRAPDKLAAAAGIMIKESGLEVIADWTAGGMLRVGS
jgi:hypothetical protein